MTNLARVAERHHQRGRRTQHQNRTHRIANLDVARQDDSVNRRLNRGVTQLFFQLFQVGAVLRQLSLGLADLGLQNLQLRFGDILLVQRHLVILLRVVERGSRNHSVLRHALGARIRAFQQRNVRALGVDLGAFQVRARAVQAGARSLQLRARLFDPSLNLFLVKFGEHLPLLHLVAIFDVKLFHDAAGLGLDFDLGDGLYLARRHHAFRQVSLLDLGELRGVDLGATAGCDQRPGNHQDENDCRYRAPDDSPAPFFLSAAIAVAFHAASCLISIRRTGIQ